MHFVQKKLRTFDPTATQRKPQKRKGQMCLAPSERNNKLSHFLPFLIAQRWPPTAAASKHPVESEIKKKGGEKRAGTSAKVRFGTFRTVALGPENERGQRGGCDTGKAARGTLLDVLAHRIDGNKVRVESWRGCHLTAGQARRRLSFFLGRKA